MSVYRSIILQILIRGRPSTDADTEKRLLTARRPASEESVAARRLDGVVELTVGETILIDDVLLGVHRRLYAVGALLLSPSQSSHRLILRVVAPRS